MLYFIKCEQSFSTRGRAQIKAKSKQDFIFDLCVENSVNLCKRSSNQIHIYIENEKTLLTFSKSLEQSLVSSFKNPVIIVQTKFTFSVF